eukprot:8602484-Pyramimonas_sp.AAC.1
MVDSTVSTSSPSSDLAAWRQRESVPHAPRGGPLMGGEKRSVGFGTYLMGLEMMSDRLFDYVSEFRHGSIIVELVEELVGEFGRDELGGGAKYTTINGRFTTIRGKGT